MKVSTDALLLGSWANVYDAKSVLDIGTGSGILAIMMAQKSVPDCNIVGIDIDGSAAAQAIKNMDSSPWSDRLSCCHVGLTDFQPPDKFDVIVSNPPFFVPKSGDLSDGDANFIHESRRIARHTKALDLDILLGRVSELLTDDGTFYCVLPAQINSVETLANQRGLYCSKRLKVYSKPEKSAIRVLYCFTKHPIETVEKTVTIYDEQSRYSEEYRNLCQAFYLNF